MNKVNNNMKKTTKKDKRIKMKKIKEILVDSSMILYFIILPFLFYWIVLESFSREFFSDFGIKPLISLLIFMIFFISLSFVKYFFLKNKKKGRIHNFSKNVSLWGILGISIILSFLLLSFSIYSSYTQYPLPIEGQLPITINESDKIFEENLNAPPHVNCYNERGERDYIVNNRIICTLQLDYKENYNSYLHHLKITYIFKNGSQTLESRDMHKDNIEGLKQIWSFDIKITEDYDQSLTSLYFVNESGDSIKTNQIFLIPRKILSQEEYNYKKEKSFLLFLTAISILIFSTIISLKNFRDLCKKYP